MSKWPDGTPKSTNTAFNWRKFSSISMVDEQTARNNAKNTSSSIESKRKAGEDIRAVKGMGSKDILRTRQVIAYSKA